MNKLLIVTTWFICTMAMANDDNNWADNSKSNWSPMCVQGNLIAIMNDGHSGAVTAPLTDHITHKPLMCLVDVSKNSQILVLGRAGSEPKPIKQYMEDRLGYLKFQYSVKRNDNLELSSK